VPKLSIIIPCYNEAKNLPALFKKLEVLESNKIEIILINNGSTDNTYSILSKEIKKKKYFKFISIKKNIGYGHGIMSGINAASGEIIAWTHADLQTDPKDVLDAYSNYIKYSDYKFRILKGRRVGRQFSELFFTNGMSLISSFLLGFKLDDINAQPKIFHKSFIKLMKNAPNDFTLDLYFLYLAKVNGYKIIEYPVYFNQRLYGYSKGGGSFFGKIKLIIHTFFYIIKLNKTIWN